MQDIRPRYVIKNNTFVSKRKDIEEEIGDLKQPTFYPQVKLKKWNNEVNFSVRLIHNEKDIKVYSESDKLVWQGRNTTAHYYPLDADERNSDGGFEFEVIFFKKPESNKVQFSMQTKGLDFFYQPTLIEELKAGHIEVPEGGRVTETHVFDKDGNILHERSEDVIHSYAVYHKEKTGDFTDFGLPNYMAGKVCHIYRPHVRDALGTKVWCDIHIDESNQIAEITIPQLFLDQAVYPIIVDPTFGYTTLGSSSGSYGNTLVGSTFQAPVACAALTLHAGISNGALQNFKLGLYIGSTVPTGSGLNGNKGALLTNSTTDQGTTANSSASRWESAGYAGTKPLLDLNGFYHIVFNAASYFSLYDSAAGYEGEYMTEAYDGTFPATWSRAGGDNDGRKHSRYVTYVQAQTIATAAATNVGQQVATLNGEITDTGGANATARGFVYGTTSKTAPGNVAPASAGYDTVITESGDFGTGAFTGAASSLNPNVTYYARAWSQNSYGYSYGDEVSFITQAMLAGSAGKGVSVSNLNILEVA